MVPSAFIVPTYPLSINSCSVYPPVFRGRGVGVLDVIPILSLTETEHVATNSFDSLYKFIFTVPGFPPVMQDFYIQA